MHPCRLSVCVYVFISPVIRYSSVHSTAPSKKIHQFWCLLAVSAVAAAAVLLFFLCIVNNSTALVGYSVYFSKCWAYVLYETSTELLIALHKKEAISDPFPKWNTFLFPFYHSSAFGNFIVPIYLLKSF